MNCLIFHGFEGYNKENWFPWLKKELNKIGVDTEVPNFPNSEEPKLSEWLEHLDNYEINENTILIGHSLGSVLILRLLGKGVKVNAAFLTAVFARDLNREVLEKSGFFEGTFNWQEIRKGADCFEVLTSKNDPYLEVEDGEKVAQGLKVNNQVLDVYKHFNIEKFPLLLSKVKNFIENYD